LKKEGLQRELWNNPEGFGFFNKLFLQKFFQKSLDMVIKIDNHVVVVNKIKPWITMAWKIPFYNEKVEEQTLFIPLLKRQKKRPKKISTLQ